MKIKKLEAQQVKNAIDLLQFIKPEYNRDMIQFIERVSMLSNGQDIEILRRDARALLAKLEGRWG